MGAVLDDVSPLFTPYQMGPFHLSHRMVYAPLTRSRALGNIPQPNAIKYYSQRATEGGLMLTEGTATSQEGQGYPNVPGLYTKEQVEAWKPIIKAVKDKGATFFCQLWHCGRASHPEYQPDGGLPVGPSALPITDGNQVYISEGPVDYPVCRELKTEEMPRLVEDFRKAARAAMEAGFDGVEIHGANGYLIDEFLKDGMNKRTDQYGGSIENRARFALEIVDACVAEVGKERVGIRFSPFGGFLSAEDSDPYATNIYVCEELSKRDILYVHFIEPRVGGNDDRDAGELTVEPFRKAFKNTFLAAGGFKRETGAEAIKSGHCDLVVYGRLFLSNPDLPKRFKLNAPLNKYDRNTFYLPDQVKGYIDYPFLEEMEKAEEK